VLFEGFGVGVVRFYEELAANNTRDWWHANRARYERDVRAPLEHLLEDLRGEFGEAKVFRPNRDTRFSKDKSPYKTNIGASFPWVADEPADGGARSHTSNVHSSGGYFHLQPGEIYVGGGIWHPEKPWIDAFRRRVADDPDEIGALLGDRVFKKTFGSLSKDGHALQRVPTGYPADHPAADLLKLKDVVFGRRLSDADATSPRLPDVIADSFAAGLPMMRFLSAIG
jgi:uncharacterized protein (TIGR02453 family)